MDLLKSNPGLVWRLRNKHLSLIKLISNREQNVVVKMHQRTSSRDMRIKQTLWHRAAHEKRRPRPQPGMPMRTWAFGSANAPWNIWNLAGCHRHHMSPMVSYMSLVCLHTGLTCWGCQWYDGIKSTSNGQLTGAWICDLDTCRYSDARTIVIQSNNRFSKLRYVQSMKIHHV